MKIYVPFVAATAVVVATHTWTAVESYTPSTGSSELGRREMLRNLAGSSVAAAAFVTTTIATPSVAQAIDACPKGSNNCILTTWTPPSGTSANDAASTLEKVIKSYPQEGQSKVDLGGYTVVEDSFGPGKTASLEYKSGIGNFAKFFNGGKPFVDDLKLEIGNDGVVNVRSSSRVGDSDLGVNQKRLVRFASQTMVKGCCCLYTFAVRCI
jgi:Protein of unknown function (DUF1499)